MIVEINMLRQNLNNNDPIVDLSSYKQTGDICLRISTLQKKNQHIFQFVSTKPEEGVTTIALNIARLMAKDKRNKILLADFNFKHPHISNIYSAGGEPGISQLFSGQNSISDVNQFIKQKNSLNILPAGISPGEAIPEISSIKCSELMNSLRNQFDYILIDSPPLMTGHNALAIALNSDATILILMSGKNHVKVVTNALSQFSNNNCAIGFTVLNRFRQSIPNWLYKRI